MACRPNVDGSDLGELLACVLVGLGVTSLSMAASAVSGVGAQLAGVTFEQCEQAAQAVLAAGDSAAARERARKALRWLGTSMIAGYLSERQCRRRLTPGSLDPVETPIVAAGFGGTVAMAVLSRP